MFFGREALEDQASGNHTCVQQMRPLDKHRMDAYVGRCASGTWWRMVVHDMGSLSEAPDGSFQGTKSANRIRFLNRSIGNRNAKIKQPNGGHGIVEQPLVF